MSSFLTPLRAEALPDGRNWKLTKPFSYHIGSRHSRHPIRVPVGFITDFASTDVLQVVALILITLDIVFLRIIPEWLTILILFVAMMAIIITPYGKHCKAAAIHDYLYQTHKVSKLMSDLIFYEAMRVANTAKWKAVSMYLAVLLFGWPAYWNGAKKYRRNMIERF